MSFDILIRKSDRRILGVFPTSEKLRHPWTAAERDENAFVIVRRELESSAVKAMTRNHYRAGENPSGKISGNIYSDVELELLPEAEWAGPEEG